MKDIKILEKCEKCGEHLTLMLSVRMDDSKRCFAVKRCLNCYQYPVEEVVEVVVVK